MKFEIVSKYADAGLNLPVRKTAKSAGYDFQVAEDTIIPSYFNIMRALKQCKENEYECNYQSNLLTLTSHEYKTLNEVAALTKYTNCKPTLVPTGIKCKMPEDTYLELSVRSSCPLKYWLILANGVGIIDADYYNNPDNEGHIFFQIINLSPFDIVLHKGDTIGQGILKKYYTTDDDAACGERTGGFGSTTDKFVVDKILSCGVYTQEGQKVSEWNLNGESVEACNPKSYPYFVSAEQLKRMEKRNNE